jgi:O-antigen/teichoic acid export membrane protein
MLDRLRESIRRRKTTLSSVGALMSTQVLATGLGGVSCFIQARFIDPKVWGYFGTFAILTQYLNFLHIGWLTSLHRDYPYWMGKGDPQRAKRAVAVAESWVLLISCLVGALFLCLTVISLLLGNLMAAAAWASQMLIATSSFYTLYLNATYRTANEFVTWSKISAVSSVMSFLMLPVVAWLGFWGLCLRGTAPVAVGGYLLHRLRPVRVFPEWNFREFLGMLKFGLAIDLAGYLATSGTRATMGLLVATAFGDFTWGLFVFALNGELVVTQFSNAIAQVFMPRISQQMGITGDLRHCARYSLKPTLAGTCVALAVIVAANAVCQPLIAFVAPKWIPSIPIFRVFLWSGICPVLLIPSYALLAAKHTWPITVSNIACFAVFVAIGGAAVLLGSPFLLVAIAYLIGKLTAVAVCMIWLWLKMQSWGGSAMESEPRLPQPANVGLLTDLQPTSSEV